MMELMNKQVKVTYSNGFEVEGKVYDVSTNGRYIHVENKVDYYMADLQKDKVKVIEEEKKVDAITVVKEKNNFTATAIKKKIKEAMHGVSKISVTIGDYEEEEHEGKFDINVNVWGYDKHYNEEFECYSETMDDKKKAIAKAKRLATTLANSYEKVKYGGIENA
ncbi:hypothetical protein [Bacillus cereus]|nr:hypothetical protein [Bacillus cereus]